jgi:hypothetical protein
MITDEQVRWTALFFLFVFMDEKIAFQAAQKVVAQVKAQSGNDSGLERVSLLKIIRKNYDQFRRHVQRNRPTLTPDSLWVLPSGFDIRPWVKFQKEAADGEIIAVVLSKLLGFTDLEISDGMNISIGTVRYRIGKGVKQLGLICRIRN